MGKYIFNYTIRRDGSSRFGKNVSNGVKLGSNVFSMLPSVAASWLISSEKMLAGSKIIDLLKLRASYGLSGNDDIGNYSSRQTYGSQNLLGMQGLVRNGIGNPYLQWETGRKINLGVDLAAFNERLGLTIDVYKNKTSNMLVYEELPAASGFNTILTNNGSMENTGIELSLNYRVLNKRHFKWDIGLNAGTNKNEILPVPNGMFTTEYAGAEILTRTGSSANLFYGYVSEGIFSTAAEATAAGLTKKNKDGSYSAFGAGDIRFKDKNGDKIIDANDKEVIGDPTPEFFGGFTNRFIYKKFQLEALFTF